MPDTNRDAGDCGHPHYDLTATCTLPTGHGGRWHQGTNPHTGVSIRYRTAPTARHTQEWIPDDDPGAPNSGEWITLHYVETVHAPTPTVSADLDQSAASLASSHFPVGHIRQATEGAHEEQCGCGTWYPAGRRSLHVGQEISRLARAFFDLGLEAGINAAGTS
ncbi:hypothetical protein [Kitasatospora sp. NPDC086791]|uniref:hypothetical protein n=1 Tax=Kitasatospora sp. NPDC086791 TaxID=3155178 RepID=UPI00343F4B4B